MAVGVVDNMIEIFEVVRGLPLEIKTSRLSRFRIASCKAISLPTSSLQHHPLQDAHIPKAIVSSAIKMRLFFRHGTRWAIPRASAQYCVTFSCDRSSNHCYVKVSQCRCTRSYREIKYTAWSRNGVKHFIFVAISRRNFSSQALQLWVGCVPTASFMLG